MDHYLKFAKDLAKQAGEIMLEHFKLGVEKEIKSDLTPVTIADNKINQLVIDAVAEKFPKHSVLGEEDSSDSTDTEYIWVCDPIDGTIPYTLGIPINMFSLALVKDGISVLGVLYDPYMDRMFEAVKDGPALLNGQPIKVNDLLPPHGYVTMPSQQYGVTNASNLVKQAMDNGIRGFSLCCVVYESMLVASGQIAGVIFPGKTPWDIAAVKVIVEAAGGKVTDLYGKEQRYDQPIAGAIVSNGAVHDQLVKLLDGNIQA